MVTSERTGSADNLAQPVRFVLASPVPTSHPPTSIIRPEAKAKSRTSCRKLIGHHLGTKRLRGLPRLSLLQLCPIGALGLGLGYWALGLGLRPIRRIALTAFLLIAAVAVVRLALPGPFCAVPWPYPISALCPR